MKYKNITTSLLVLLFAIPAAFGQPGAKEIKKLYKDYMGKIVFSHNPVDLNNFNEAELQSNFDLTDDLYFRFFMDKTLSDYYKSENFDQNFSDEKFDYNYGYKIYVNDKLQGTWLFRLGEEGYFKNVTLGGVLSTKDKNKKRKYSEIVNPWVEIVSEMETGENNVKVELIPMNELLAGQEVDVLARGKFTINIQPDKMESFVKTHTTGLPDPTVTAQKIENEILEVSGDAFENARPFRVVITDYNGDWNYTTDEDGHIIYRYITASVVYNFLAEEECWVRSIVFSQEHQGYGEFGPVFYDKLAEGYYDYRIPCYKAENQ